MCQKLMISIIQQSTTGEVWPQCCAVYFSCRHSFILSGTCIPLTGVFAELLWVVMHSSPQLSFVLSTCMCGLCDMLWFLYLKVRAYLLRVPAESLQEGRSLLGRLVNLIVAPDSPAVRQVRSTRTDFLC